MRYLLPFPHAFSPPSPDPSVLSPSHCSRGKPIAGNTSLGSDRKEGRKESRRNRGIVTTPLPRARPLCRSCCSFGGGADVARRRGRRRSAGECLITPDFFSLRRPLSLTRSHTHTHASYLMSHLCNLEEPPRHKTLLTSRNLPLRARPEDSIPLFLGRLRRLPFLFPFRLLFLRIPLYASLLMRLRLLAPIKRSDSLFSRSTRRSPSG